ncbi:FIST signal transduction protein [Polyangium aurulentum]|uniref:FIST signal transduction protein n=1 Tax=Polyangium aurulentum TaxID=2567896 RepID=UPI0010AEE6F7|nr:FIST N-terminal domain-containing protein [Polyangium aurulentum]UQA55837.1 FIST C-terminal domain-containing protein [Polyangium aurulentum]
MSVRTAHSMQQGADDAALELRRALSPSEPVLVLYFAGGARDHAALAFAMRLAFPGALVVGCSTAGEIEGGAMLQGSVVAIGLGDDVVRDAHAAVLKDLSTRPDLRDAVEPLEAHFGRPLAKLDPARYCGVLLVDGLSGAEERVIDRLGDLTDVVIVGGSAGDDLAFQRTFVAAEGEVHSDAAVLLVIEPAAGFRVLKTQSFRPLGRTLRVTRADEETRTVHAFDGRPAAVAYAEAIGTTASDLPAHFMRHPLGLMVGEEPFVRSPQQIKGESVVFYCNVREGMELMVLEATDVVEDTRKALEAARTELGGLSALIDFDCVLRALEIDSTGKREAYGGLFAGLAAAGFHTYGELFLGHVNQTSTMLLLR